MAGLVVTAEALACIRECIEREEIQRPMVALCWSQGAADLTRGAKGEAIWEHEQPRWMVTVMDLAELEEAGAPWVGPTVTLHGYAFAFIARPGSPQLEGCMLACEGGELVVYESAT